MQSGYSMGFLLSSVVFQFGYPLVNHENVGWRVMLWIGVLPAFLVLYMRAHSLYPPEAPAGFVQSGIRIAAEQIPNGRLQIGRDHEPRDVALMTGRRIGTGAVPEVDRVSRGIVTRDG